MARSSRTPEARKGNEILNHSHVPIYISISVMKTKPVGGRKRTHLLQSI